MKEGEIIAEKEGSKVGWRRAGELRFFRGPLPKSRGCRWFDVSIQHLHGLFV